MPWDLAKQTNKSPFEKAIRQNSVLLIQQQISAGNILRDSDLLYAVENQYDSLEFLLRKGLNPNALDSSGKNLLFHVTDIRAFEIILRSIKDINHQDLAGDTIHHQLVRDYFKKNNLSFIELCLARNPDLSLHNKRGKTVLLSIPVPALQPVFDQLILMSRHMPEFLMLVDTLLSAGSSISEVDAEGNTLLHRVCQSMLADEHLQIMIQELINRGASIHTKNSRGVNILAQILVKIDIDRIEKIGDPVTYAASNSLSLSDGYQGNQVYGDFQEDPIHES